MDKKPIFRRLSEWLFIVIAFFIWAFSAPFIRLMDPTAAIFDSGVFQALIYSVVGLFIFITVDWFILWFRFPGIYHFLDKRFSRTFKNLTEWQQTKVSLFVFFAFLFLLAFMASIIL